METVARTGVTSTLSYVIFVGLKDRTILGSIPTPAAAYDFISTINVVYLFYGAVLGVLCGIVGLFRYDCLADFAKVGDAVCQGIDKLGIGVINDAEGDHDARVSRTHLGIVLTPALGGFLVGLLAVACPLTLGDGSAQENAILVGAASLGVGTLIVSALVKLVALSISLGFGFVGGPMFPFIFTGACIGSAAHTFWFQRCLSWWPFQSAWQRHRVPS